MNIHVENDFDGYFEAWATELQKELEVIKCPVTKITVDAGPYRPYGLCYSVKSTEVELDFYSGVRAGFGSIGITPAELAAEIKIKVW